jgi:iron complex transport system permease protein
MRRSLSPWLLLAMVLSVVSPLFAIAFGAAQISLAEVLAVIAHALGLGGEVNAITERIVWDLRLPRTLLAFTCGAGLAVAGAVLQTVTRNPLADPYLFGISSGASFGAVLVIAALSAGQASMSGASITTGAFVGSTLSVALVLSLAGRGIQIERMLLAGVAVSFMFSAGTSLVLYASDPQATASLLFWTLGSFNTATWERLLFPVLVIALSMVVFWAYARPLRAVLAGDESARALGVDVRKLRMGMLMLASLMTATLVANCGGIGFVGLMIPHIVRRLLQRHSNTLFVACALYGGVFMVWVDVLARKLVEGSELPIGIITAAIGSLFFLMVLRRRSSV